MAAIFHLLWETETETVPKIVNITVDYLRSARPVDVIAAANERAGLTLAARGAHGSLPGRGRVVADMLDRPVCLGCTASGEPRHPSTSAHRRLLSMTTGTAQRPQRDCPKR
jgi:hypothetical protein